MVKARLKQFDRVHNVQGSKVQVSKVHAVVQLLLLNVHTRRPSRAGEGKRKRKRELTSADFPVSTYLSSEVQGKLSKMQNKHASN